jgi:GntR family transcriptional regulator, rspAB operon transcriptional repressor
VREAIIRLAEEGLLTVVPKGGTYVSPIEIQRYVEACFVRAHLEESAAVEAAKHRSFEDIVRIEACIARQIEAAEKEEFKNFFLLDEEFHRAIFIAARIPCVWSFVNQAKGEVDRMRHLKRLFGVRRLSNVIEEHQSPAQAARL